MKLRVVFGGIVFVGAMMVICPRAMTQDQDKGNQPGEQMTEDWMKHAQPGKFHAHLEPLVGRWTQSVKMWMAPGAPPVVSTGTTESKWILGGRFLLQEVKEDVKGDMDHPPFEGAGLIGYDNFKKKYTSVWVDNMGTAIMTSLGTCDDSGKVFTMIGRHDDVFTGRLDQKFKAITRIVDNDTLIDEMYVTGPDGKEFKMLEITYTRRK